MYQSISKRIYFHFGGGRGEGERVGGGMLAATGGVW